MVRKIPILLFLIFLSACNHPDDAQIIKTAVGNGDGVIVEMVVGNEACSYKVRKIIIADCWGDSTLLFCNESWLEPLGCSTLIPEE